MDPERMIRELAAALGHEYRPDPKTTQQERWAKLLRAANIYAETYAED